MDIQDAKELAVQAGTIATAVKGAVDTLKSLLPKKGERNADADEPLSSALDRVLSIQTMALDLQAAAFRLQDELAQAKRQLAQSEQECNRLREQVRESEGRLTDRQQYREATVGKARVLVRVDGPADTFYCPTCFKASGVALPLQLHPFGGPFDGFGSHWCSTCETGFFIHD